mgnify:CR=1 FL=1
MKPKVLNTIPKSLFETHCKRAKKLLEDNGFEVLTYQGERVMTADEIKAVGSDLCAAIVGCDAWTEEVIAACPKLKVLARFGIGVESIDLEAAKRHGVKVCNARGMNSDSVAEMTILQVLAVYRNLINLDRTTREGDWMRYAGHTIHNKVYGLIGFGAIAQNVAKLLSGFGVREILAYDMFPNHEAAGRLGVTLTDFESVVTKSDIISLHVPGTKDTAGLFNESVFRKMKSEAILINVARGSVVSQSALYRALKEHWIAGAGLDVYEAEPTGRGNPLFTLNNIVLTPHQAGDTKETFDAVSYFDAQVILDVMNGKEPPNWLNR